MGYTIKSYSTDELKEMTYNYLIENGIATESEVDLVTDINGYNLTALNDILEVRTSYTDLEGYTELEDSEYFEEYFLIEDDDDEDDDDEDDDDEDEDDEDEEEEDDEDEEE